MSQDVEEMHREHDKALILGFDAVSDPDDPEKGDRSVTMDSFEGNKAGDEDDDIMELDPESSKDGEQVDQRALERIASAPVLGGDVVMTIFDAAMKEYKNDLKLAREFFEIVAAFDEVPSVSKLMHHIVQHMNLVNPDAPETIISEAKSHLVGTDPASAGFVKSF